MSKYSTDEQRGQFADVVKGPQALPLDILLEFIVICFDDKCCDFLLKSSNSATE
jgi:hypothetical protein